MSHKALTVAACILSFAVALLISGIGGCNVHELGHLATGRAMGIPVDDIFWCTPTDGRIAFAYQEPALVGFAGGFSAALVLGGLYSAVVRPRLGSLIWWVSGVAVLGTAISQVIVGIWEGGSPEGYGAAQENVAGLIALLVAPLVGASVLQLLVQKPSFDGSR